MLRCCRAANLGHMLTQGEPRHATCASTSVLTLMCLFIICALQCKYHQAKSLRRVTTQGERRYDLVASHVIANSSVFNKYTTLNGNIVAQQSCDTYQLKVRLVFHFEICFLGPSSNVAGNTVAQQTWDNYPLKVSRATLFTFRHSF